MICSFSPPKKYSNSANNQKVPAGYDHNVNPYKPGIQPIAVNSRSLGVPLKAFSIQTVHILGAISNALHFKQMSKIQMFELRIRALISKC